MPDPIINSHSYPPMTGADLVAPVLVEDLKAAWPYCHEIGKQKQTGHVRKPSASLSALIRCGLLEQLLGGAEPTDEQFAAMAEAPLDGTVNKEELMKRLGV